MDAAARRLAMQIAADLVCRMTRLPWRVVLLEEARRRIGGGACEQLPGQRILQLGRSVEVPNTVWRIGGAAGRFCSILGSRRFGSGVALLATK